MPCAWLSGAARFPAIFAFSAPLGAAGVTWVLTNMMGSRIHMLGAKAGKTARVVDGRVVVDDDGTRASASSLEDSVERHETQSRDCFPVPASKPAAECSPSQGVAVRGGSGGVVLFESPVAPAAAPRAEAARSTEGSARHAPWFEVGGGDGEQAQFLGPAVEEVSLLDSLLGSGGAAGRESPLKLFGTPSAAAARQTR